MLSGTNLYTGATTISAGTLRNGAAGVIADTSAISIADSATWDLNNYNETVASIADVAGNTTGSITLGTATLTISGSVDTTFSGVISGTGSLNKAGTGILTLLGANTFSAGTTVSSGATLTLNNSSSLGSGTLVNNGTVQVANGVTAITIQGLSGTNASAVLNLTNLGSQAVVLTLGENNADTTYAGKISGTGSAVKKGSGTLTLSGTSDYTGATTISEGVVKITNAAALGDASTGTTVANAAALEISGGITVNELLTLNGSGELSGGALRSVSGNNDYHGAITLATASRINNDADTLTISGDITGAKNLTIGGSANTSVTGVIGIDAGLLTKDGAGTLTLSNTNTYTGGTTLLAGIVSLGHSGAISTTGTLSFTGGVLQLRATNHLNLIRMVGPLLLPQRFKGRQVR